MTADTDKTWRQVYLTVALAVAEGLPAPKWFCSNSSTPDEKLVVIDCFTTDDAIRWSYWLRSFCPEVTNADHNYYGDGAGWKWHVHEPFMEESDDTPDPAAAVLLETALYATEEREDLTMSEPLAQSAIGPATITTRLTRRYRTTYEMRITGGTYDGHGRLYAKKEDALFAHDAAMAALSFGLRPNVEPPSALPHTVPGNTADEKKNGVAL